MRPACARAACVCISVCGANLVMVAVTQDSTMRRHGSGFARPVPNFAVHYPWGPLASFGPGFAKPVTVLPAPGTSVASTAASNTGTGTADGNLRLFPREII